MQIVWFKRDLRIQDHAALTNASKLGPFIPLYIIEPELWAQPDMSHRHYAFLLECLNELNQTLQSLGQPLIIKVGDAPTILNDIIDQLNVHTLWSHQETWNDWTYKRDIKIKKMVAQKNVVWNEPRQNGVIRRLKTRDGWSNRWYQFMNDHLNHPPTLIAPIPNIQSDPISSFEDLNLHYDECHQRQIGGRTHAVSILKSFLIDRGLYYPKQMSSPITAFEACSRLSPYIAFGVISIREVFKSMQKRIKQVNETPMDPNSKQWLRSMKFFESRLMWHCHFSQKLEDEPSIENHNMHSSYDDVLNNNWNQNYYDAWATGHTGFPFVDACMRALIATGWINFRMRAMLMSFASYHLGLDWRKTSIHLARLFTDYEPGIHYPQCQMQSGTTGINTLRIYNPYKQSMDQDPMGIFIKLWIPELNHVSNELIHMPHTPIGDTVDSLNYPWPIIDEQQSRHMALDRMASIRHSENHINEASKVLKKHGSRQWKKFSKPLHKKKINPTNGPSQLRLPFKEDQ
jgi:deoxyribodipyrimidine photo-lyase